MLTEQQIQPPATATENAPQPQSGESKESKRGGKRPAPAASRTARSACSSDDEMEMLDNVTKKLAGPVLDIAQDAPQNQIDITESNRLASCGCWKEWTCNWAAKYKESNRCTFSPKFVA